MRLLIYICKISVNEWHCCCCWSFSINSTHTHTQLEMANMTASTFCDPEHNPFWIIIDMIVLGIVSMLIVGMRALSARAEVRAPPPSPRPWGEEEEEQEV